MGFGRTYIVKLLLSALCILVFSGWQSKANADISEKFRRFQFNLQHIISKSPHYDWGGSGPDLRKGLDCSGYLFRAAKWSGMPVRRTTARRMALGEEGWGHVLVPDLTSIQPLDIVWWTFKVLRPNGHVGVIWTKWIKKSTGWPVWDGITLTVTHASGGRKRVVVDRIRGSLRTKISRIGRLK